MPADEYKDVSVSLVEKSIDDKKRRKVRNTSRKQSKRDTSDLSDVVAVIKTEAFRIEPTKGIKAQQVFKLVPKHNLTRKVTVVSTKSAVTGTVTNSLVSKGSVSPVIRKTTLIAPKVNILPKKKTMKLKIIEKKISFPKITLPASKLKISLEKTKTKKRDYKERKLRIEL